MAMPDGTEQEVPTGIALEIMLAEIRANLGRHSEPRQFDLPFVEGYAVVQLSDDGYSDRSAWWLAREARVAQCVDEVPEG